LTTSHLDFPHVNQYRRLHAMITESHSVRGSSNGLSRCCGCATPRRKPLDGFSSTGCLRNYEWSMSKRNSGVKKKRLPMYDSANVRLSRALCTRVSKSCRTPGLSTASPEILALLHSDLQERPNRYSQLSTVTLRYLKGSSLDPPTLYSSQERAGIVKLGISVIIEWSSTLIIRSGSTS
jgi:hypothetical protein